MFKFMDYEFECDNCGEEVEINVPLTESGMVDRVTVVCKSCGKKYSAQGTVAVDINEVA